MFPPHPLNFRVLAADNRGVDQVSRPMQIALCAIVLLAGMWFVVLRPKADDGGSAAPAAAPAAPGTTGLGNAVSKANGAVKASQQSAKATETAVAKAGGDAAATTAGGTAAKSSAAPTASTGSTASKPATAAAPADPSVALLDKLSHGKTVVLLFAGKGADDRAARKAVRRLAAHDKGVVTKVAPITQVGDYEAITTGVQVLTAPTVVVIGKDRKAQSVSGYTEQGVLKQLVGDARRADKS